MSEIAKLYENAGVLKECLSPCYINKTWRKTHDCPNCDNRENYPPFTAEKQLKIVKMILFSTWWLNLKRLQFSEKFDEGLAQMINELWQDLTEEEKASIKNILEM